MRFYTACLIITVSADLHAQMQPRNFCTEWGFETGTLGGWTCQIGPFGAPVFPVACSTSSMHAVMTPGFDLEPTIPRVPYGGSGYAVRIGDYKVTANLKAFGDAAAIERVFTVTPATAKLEYYYALGLQDGSHSPAEQPYFRVIITVGSQVVYAFMKIASPNDIFFEPGEHSLIRRWSCAVADLSNYIGQTARIRIEASDCSPNAHFGYAYVDFPCLKKEVVLSTPETICDGDHLMVDGSGNIGAIAHWWSVTLSDANWGGGPEHEVGEWSGGDPGQADISSLATHLGKPLQCGNYYKVKLALKTECVDWIETTRLVYIGCGPAVTAGPDRFICVTNPLPVTLGPATSMAGVSYQWLVGTTVIATSPQLTVSPSQSTQYVLLATDTKSGCRSADSAWVHVWKNFAVNVNRCFCGNEATLTANVDSESGPATYLWSPGGQTTKSITAQPSVDTTYTVTVTTECNSHSGSTSLVAAPPLDVIAPNAFRPLSPNPKVANFCVIQLGIADKPAYDAEEWRLSVFDRWGSELYVGTGTDNGCDSFSNWTACWDGRSNRNVSYSPWQILFGHRVNTPSGVLQPVGVYTYRFERKRCNGSWTIVPVNGDMTPSVLLLN